MLDYTNLRAVRPGRTLYVGLHRRPLLPSSSKLHHQFMVRIVSGRVEIEPLAEDHTPRLK
jgi:hypothetical protein